MAKSVKVSGVRPRKSLQGAGTDRVAGWWPFPAFRRDEQWRRYTRTAANADRRRHNTSHRGAADLDHPVWEDAGSAHGWGVGESSGRDLANATAGTHIWSVAEVLP